MVDRWLEIGSVIQEQQSEARKDEDKALTQNTVKGEQRKRDP